MDFKVRMPTCEEWDRLADIVHEDDTAMHWKRMYSWCINKNKKYSSCRVVRGYDSPRFQNAKKTVNFSIDLGFRPAFVPLIPNSTENGKIVRIATLYMDGNPVLVPLYTEWDGDTKKYREGAKLKFREPLLDNFQYQIRAIKVDGVYIADRNLLCSISWDELSQQGFSYQILSPKATLPTLEAAVTALNWEKMFCWLDEPIRCEYLAPDFTVITDPAVKGEKVGFRPMFAGDPNIPNGEGFPVATLYLSGTPVKIPKHPDYEGDIPVFQTGDKIEFRKPLDDPEYQITATAVGGKLIADYCVLRNISWNELKAQGF